MHRSPCLQRIYMDSYYLTPAVLLPLADAAPSLLYLHLTMGDPEMHVSPARSDPVVNTAMEAMTRQLFSGRLRSVKLIIY